MLTSVGLRPPSVSKTECHKNENLSPFFQSHIIDKRTISFKNYCLATCFSLILCYNDIKNEILLFRKDNCYW